MDTPGVEATCQTWKKKTTTLCNCRLLKQTIQEVILVSLPLIERCQMQQCGLCEKGLLCASVRKKQMRISEPLHQVFPPIRAPLTVWHYCFDENGDFWWPEWLCQLYTAIISDGLVLISNTKRSPALFFLFCCHMANPCRHSQDPFSQPQNALHRRTKDTLSGFSFDTHGRKKYYN